MTSGPTISFYDTKFFISIGFKYSPDKALVIVTHGFVADRQTGAIQIFTHRYNEFHSIEIRLLDFQNAAACFFQYFLKFGQKISKLQILIQHILTEFVTRPSSRFNEYFLCGFDIVPFNQDIPDGVLKQSIVWYGNSRA